MSEEDHRYPEWLRNQRGFRYRGHGQFPSGFGPWMNRTRIIRRYADEFSTAGQLVTIKMIREMLIYLDRGYSLKADQIGFALRGRYSSHTIAKYTNATTVVIDRQRHRSIRAAAETLGVSPQTVINRINSQDRKWKGWRREY